VGPGSSAQGMYQGIKPLPELISSDQAVSKPGLPVNPSPARVILYARRG
jgi:hypothetical protein